MSGETEANPSGWTPDQLREYLDRMLAERDVRFQQRFDAQNEALSTFPPVAQQVGQLAVRVDGFSDLMEAKFVTYRTLIDSQAEKVALALASADKAVGKAETSFERQVTAATEAIDRLRVQMGEMVRVDYLQQALTSRDALIAACTERVRELELARSSGAGGQAKVTDQRAMIAAVVGVATFVLALVVVLVNVLTSG